MAAILARWSHQNLLSIDPIVSAKNMFEYIDSSPI